LLLTPLPLLLVFLSAKALPRASLTFRLKRFNFRPTGHLPGDVTPVRVLLKFFCFAFFLATFPLVLAGQDTKYPPQTNFIPTPVCRSGDLSFMPLRPCSQDMVEAWRKDITHWRQEELLRAGYDGSEYERPELKWTQSSYIQPQMMVEDRYFYDPVTQKYTVDRYLDDLEKRYGGIDAVLVWHIYPNVGIDNRNQYDMLRAMPGGVAGLKQMVADFHRRGVRVFFPVIMWDQGTRDEGKLNWVATAEWMAEIGADGVNGDTLHGIARAFRTASDRTGHPIALEPESAPSDEALMWNNLTWSYLQQPVTNFISRFKWLEPRHMVNISDRWNHDKIEDMQYAWLNGVGYESWENVWSIWNGITDRDAEAIRRVATLERFLSRFLVSKDWEPLTPMIQFQIFASKWPLGKDVLWTVVNRGQNDLEGRQIEVPYQKGMRYYDLYHGEELAPDRDANHSVLHFDVEAHGFGAVLGTESAPGPELQALLAKMKELTKKPLSSYSPEWKFLPQQIVDIAAVKPPLTAPQGMVRIPASEFVFRVHGIELEGGTDVGVDVQYPWESSPGRYHDHKLSVKSFWLDRYPVTNAQFNQFVAKTKYHPKDDGSFLKDWANGAVPSGWENKPVTWVSLEDARAYCSASGRRLPHEWEWQYASQGTDGRTYPWGDDWDSRAVPVPDKGRDLTGPDAVDAHPSGASPLGVMDLVGNVWQWTDEFQDEHTRTAILRGGTYYQPQGSIWYFPQAYKNDEHGKLLLMAPSKDRAGTLGFRCAADAQ